MHLITVPTNLDLGQQGNFPAGQFLVDDRNAAEIMLLYPWSRITADHCQHSGTLAGLLSETPRILVVANVGFGDAIMLTPSLREIKRRFPGCVLHVACMQEFRQVFAGLEYIDGFADYPLPKALIGNYDRLVCTEHAVEFNKEAETEHMTQRYAHHLGLGDLADPKADYKVSPDEIAWVLTSFPKTEGKKRLGMQMQAGIRSRTYPASKLSPIILKLIAMGWEVAMMGRPGEFMAEERKGLINLGRRGLTFRQSAAYLLTCDAFLGPDSSLLHISGALGLPAVGLFGSFPWIIRTAYYPSVFALQGKRGCDLAPCFHVQHTNLPAFPLNGPCAKTGICTALASIDPEEIMARILSQVRRLGPPELAAE